MKNYNHKLNANRQRPKVNGQKLYPQLVDKTISMTRQDIAKMRTAQNAFRNAENPSVWQLYNLYDYILDDATLTSQIENRIQDTLGSSFTLKQKGGDVDQELTDTFQNSELFNEIITQIINTRFYGYSVIELDWKQEGQNETQLAATLFPRQNILPKSGTLLFDYNEEKGVKYRELPEYGTWILEFGKPGEMGLINKAIPYCLFKRFATSCYSELCEIYGIPPRVMKTNTRDSGALRRAEKMMTDMGAAAWFIIDETEKLEWATTGTPATGEVYNGLIKLCRDNISLLISGAIIGQDTQYGSRSKEQSSQDILQNLIDADQTLVEQYMNSKVLPALFKIGILPMDNLLFEYDKVEDLSELWTRTKEILPYKEVPNEWIKEKFGIEVQDRKNHPQQNLSADYFFD